MKKANEKTQYLGVQAGPEETGSEAVSRTVLSPVTQAAITTAHFLSLDGPLQADFEFKDLLHNLEQQVSGTLKNETLEDSQRMLVAQAHTLDGIFHVMARFAAYRIKDNLGAGEILLKLGLKSQSQCRTTLETLNDIKNPRLATVVNQANIAGGHQQVNNYGGESEIPPSELLEAEEHERVDFGAQGEAGKAHSTVEAVGAVNRPKKRRGKKQSLP